MNEVLLKRIKSLLWRSGMMAAAVLVAGLSDGLAGLELPPLAVAVLGLALGELSKFLNSRA